MASTAPQLPPPFPARWPRWFAGVLLLLALLVAIPFAIDTPSGRAWLVRQLPGLELENGLSFRVSRIDGSLWRRATLVGVAVHDPEGRFATIDRLVLDWRPLALAYNQFDAREIGVRTARIIRLPTLRPTQDPRLLPEQDIIIDRFSIRRLELADGVAGPERALTGNGAADIRAGRAVVRLDARTLGDDGGDRLFLDLDAEPDRDRLALVARLRAPAGGVVTTLIGLDRDLELSTTGKGRWQHWDGTLIAGLGEQPRALADVVLAGRGGTITARGHIDPSPLLAGTAAEILAGGLDTSVTAAPEGGITRLAITLAGRTLSGSATGRLDRAREQLSDTQVRITLDNGAGMARSMGVSGLVATAKLAGPLLAPVVDARLTADSLTLPGDPAVRLTGLSVAGIADLNKRPVGAPIAVAVAGVSGLPQALAPLATAWRGDGRLRWQDGEVKGENVSLSAGPATARLGFGWRPATGGWALDGTATARGWPVDALGRSDGVITARLRPGPGGALAGTGTLRLAVAQPAASIARVTGGALALNGSFTLSPGLAVALPDLALASPDLNARGKASWNGGRFTLDVGGTSALAGPFTLAGNGTPAAPHLEARLPRPGYGLSDVALRLDPAETGWRVAGDGQSGLGAVTLAAGIVLSPVLVLDVERLDAGGLSARGRLAQAPAGPLAGTLSLAGRGLNGKAELSAVGGVQQAVFDLGGRAVTLPLAVPITIERIDVDGRLLLADAGPQVTATLALATLERGSLLIERADGKLALNDGRGAASLAVAGDSGAPFHGRLQADIAPGRWALTGDGDYDGRKARLEGPAVVTRDAEGWHLATTRLLSGEGNAQLAGDWGDTKRLQARLERVSLGLVSLAFPSVDLAGRVSGDLTLRQQPGGVPEGDLALRLNGLSRSSTVSTSNPIDLGLNARLAGGGSVLRAVIVRAGKVEGRIQARLGGIAAGPSPLADRLAEASVVGQLRYAGPAQDFWGLTGLTALDVRGPVQIAADLSGTLGDPQVAGRLRATGGRVEAPLLGAVATDVAADARFTASRLEFTRFSGTSGKGSITGAGSIDLSWDRGFPMDIRMEAKNAAILGRDDLTATGSGRIRVATDEYGGVVSGKLDLTRAEYAVGRTAVADVPVLAVTERNTRVLGRRTLQYVPPTRWLYNLTVNADRSLFVKGMGINSEWQADVRLRGGATAPELFGRVQLVRGDYEFAGKRFQLTRGDIRFMGGYPPDPVIAVTAENSGNGFTALLNIDGTAQKPQIKFSSLPALPEDEVLSRVLFGSSVTDLSAPEAIQLAGALASLRGGSGFNPIGAVGRGLGIDRLRILPADQATGRRTTFAAGQYVGRNVYVELATDAQGYTATSIEIGLTRSLSVLSSVATLGGTEGALRWKRDY